MKNEQELLINTTKKGQFGTVIINTYLSNSLWPEKLAIYQDIKRYEKDNNLIIEIVIASDLGNTIEEISLTKKETAFDNSIDCEINLDFIKRQDKEKVDRYFLQGNLGDYAEYQLAPVSIDTYAKARAKLIEMSNPDYEYNINEIINLLRKSNNPKISEITMNFDNIIKTANINGENKKAF